MRLYLTRLTIIKSILLGKADTLGIQTPRELVAAEVHNSRLPPNRRDPEFSLSEFFRIVAHERSIIWRDPAALETFKESIGLFMPHLRVKSTYTTVSDGFENIDEVLYAIKSGDSAVFSRLKKLPINEMKSLELINELMAMDSVNGLVSNGPWNPPVYLWAVVRDFIQHGLRQIEAMGVRQPTPAYNSSAAPDSTQGSSTSFVPEPESLESLLESFSMLDRKEDDDVPLTHVGREDQIRAVRLLCLFMRNALLKGFLFPAQIQLELREVSMQYIWIPEARALSREFLHD